MNELLENPTLLNNKPAFEAEFDSTHNIMRTHFRNRLTSEELEERLDCIDCLMTALRPGFTVVTDMSELNSMDLECAPHLARILDLERVHGVSKVIRIIPDPAKDIGINILSIIHFRGKVPTMTCKTLAEAERELGAGTSLVEACA